MIVHRTRSRASVFPSAAALLGFLFVGYLHLQRQRELLAGGLSLGQSSISRLGGTEIVVASLSHENTSWVHEYLPDWRKNIYVVDDPDAELRVPINKGREAMAYLTHIIDRYDALPDITIFHHAGRFQWHNDDPDYDGLQVLRNIRLPYIQSQGYVNLRCVWTLGCPAEIRPFEDEATAILGKPTTKQIFKQSFESLFPALKVPQVVAVSCCSQFAATREVIRQRPRDEYERFREWLVNTPLDDSLSGRVFEYSWHMLFGKEAVHCPSARECYCNLFGMCDLTCTDATCEGRYMLPPKSTLPHGWPRIGWDQEERRFDGPL